MRMCLSLNLCCSTHRYASQNTNEVANEILRYTFMTRQVELTALLQVHARCASIMYYASCQSAICRCINARAQSITSAQSFESNICVSRCLLNGSLRTQVPMLVRERAKPVSIPLRRPPNVHVRLVTSTVFCARLVR